MSAKIQAIIDCDVHNTYHSQTQLYPYLQEPWLSRLKERGFGYPPETFFSSIHPKRLDAKPEIGTAGSDYRLFKEQLLDKFSIQYAILTGEGISGVSYMPDSEYPSALASAYNQWMVEEWLDKDERFLGSLHLAIQAPETAAAEIYRWGKHPKVVQINLPAATTLPLAHPFYRPVLRAAAEMDLVIALHFRQPGLSAPSITPVGIPFHYLDYHTLVSLPYQAQLVMLVTSGVLEELPNLKFLMMEGGFIWAIHLLWRFDKEYKALNRLAPALKKLPSEYIYQHFKFGIQPIYEPREASALQRVIEAGEL
ncbi:MAG TPA: amidohydrolase family protein [Haliscomenobacter sp.]|nr:amidohydrolase family protein [Haliscomenobacter sp.]